MGARSANISRNIYEEAKRYAAFIAQMNKPAVDADWNDLSEGQATNLQRLAQYVLGNGSPNHGFKVMEAASSTNNFMLQGGGVYASLSIEGVEIDGRVIYTAAARGPGGNTIRARQQDTGSLVVQLDTLFAMSLVSGLFTLGETVTGSLGGSGTIQSVDYMLNQIVIRETAAFTLTDTITGALSGTSCRLDARSRLDIDVSIDLGVTLASAVVAAVNAHAVIPLFASAAVYGTGTKAAGAATYANFSGGEDPTEANAGRLFADGHFGMLLNDVDYINNNQITDDIHPIATAIATTSVANDTLVDSAANYEDNSLIGRELVPDILQPLSVYTITSNTATQIVVSTSMTGVAAARKNYRVNLSTPIGARLDLVYVDMFLDEVGGADDPELIHPFAPASESMRRLKVRQLVKVIQAVTDYPAARFVDSDGYEHATVPIALLHRTAKASITQAMIEDIRPSNAGIVDLKQEVVEARGTRGVLDDRLDQSLEEDGTIKSTAAVTSVTATSPVLVDGVAGPKTGAVVVSMPAATTLAAGHMTQAQAVKLDGIQALAQVNPTVELLSGSPSIAAISKLLLDHRFFGLTNPAAGQALATMANGLVVAGSAEETNFKVRAVDPATNQLRVMKGILLPQSNGRPIVRTTDGVGVTGITAVSTAGNERYDLVEVTDAGTVVYTTGTEVPAGPAIPDQATLNLSLPTPSGNRSVLAMVVATYNSGLPPAIDDSHIIDARPFIRNSSSGGVPAHTHAHTDITSALDYASSGHTGFAQAHTTHAADQLKFFYTTVNRGVAGAGNVSVTISPAMTRTPYLVLVCLRVAGGNPWSIGFGFGSANSASVGAYLYGYPVSGHTEYQTDLVASPDRVATVCGTGTTPVLTWDITGVTASGFTLSYTTTGGDPFSGSMYDFSIVVVGQ